MAASDGPTAMERFINGILPENPTFRQILGTCPTLAVTNNMKAALTMAGAVAFVLLGSNIVTSLIRKVLQPHLRILVFTLTIAGFVTIADRFLAAYMYDMSKELGPYIPLIIVNCIIIARCEVCAAKQSLLPSIGDALGQSIGYLIALSAMATIREILGDGKWLGWTLLKSAENGGFWDPWVIMLLPPGAFLTFGLLMGAVNWYSQRPKKPAQE